MSIGIGKRALVVYVALVKWVVDETFQVGSGADTWTAMSFGTHGGDSSFILASLSRLLDKGIADYLRVNESACSP